MTLPNFFTFLRIGLIPIVLLAFLTETIAGYWLAVSAFFIACVSDFFDGYFARLWAQTSRAGQWLDPIADKLLILSTLFLLAGFGRLSKLTLLPTLIILWRELLISGLREYSQQRKISLAVSELAKWKTSLQMLALGILLASAIPQLSSLKLWGEGLLWVAAALTLTTGLDYLYKLKTKAVHFARMDQKKSS